MIVDLDEETQHAALRDPLEGRHHTAVRDGEAQSGRRAKTADEDLEIIRKMAVRYGDDEIANVLNAWDVAPGPASGRTATRHDRSSQPRHRRSRRALHDPDILSLGAAARHCGVSNTTIERLVEGGLLPKEQVVPWAPWEIRRADLDSEPVRSIIERLRQTGKLVLQGDVSERQLDLSE